MSAPPKRIKVAKPPLAGRPAYKGTGLTPTPITVTPAHNQDPSTPIDIGDIDAPRSRMSLDRGKKPVPTAPASGLSTSSVAVKGMQQSILDFASAISSINLNSMKPQEHTDDSFGNFLTEQYLGAATPGALDNIAAQMKRIGAPGSHDQADGIWGNNTNQALKNITAVTRAMFGLAKDLQYPLQGYTEEQLENLEKLIPNSYTSLKNPNDKETRAKEITNHIQTLAMLFRSFKQGVMKNPQLKSFVEKKKSFLNIPQSSQSAHDVMNEEEKKIYEQYKSVPLQPSNATMLDLLSLESFKIYMSQNKMDPNNPEEIKKALDQISSTLSVG